MNIELGQLADGSLVIASDQQFPHDIRRVEYYGDQRLMMLVYDLPDHEGELMHYELSNIASDLVERAPSVMVLDKSPDLRLYAYDVPLIQVGAL